MTTLERRPRSLHETLPLKEREGFPCDIIILTGPVGSGKTTAADKLYRHHKANGEDVVQISSGEFYERKKKEGLKGVRLNRAVDKDVLNATMEAVGQGKLVIVESRVMAYNIQPLPPRAYSVLLEVSKEKQLERLIARGRNTVEEELAREERYFKELQEAYPSLRGKNLMDRNLKSEDGHRVYRIPVSTDDLKPEEVVGDIHSKILLDVLRKPRYVLVAPLAQQNTIFTRAIRGKTA